MKITKVKLLCTFALISSANLFFANKTSVYPEGFKPKATAGISFTENKGQVHDQNYNPCPDVLFGDMAGNMAFHLKTNGVSYQLTKIDSYKDVEDQKTKHTRKEIDQQTIYRIDLSWINANKNFTTSTDNTIESYNNYYLESCPDGGALNVKSYTGVTLHQLYNGINLHYYETDGQLKRDYIVAPSANYKQIQLMVDGATVSVNKDGSLTLGTPLGKVQEGAPIVYQNNKQLKAKWVIKNQTISFDIENYNPNQELIIDPVTREWGTYYGGSGNTDLGYSCSTDASGNVYMAGITNSNTGTFIATSGAHQTTFGSGTYEAFLVKFNSAGVRQWGTYYGGNGNQEGLGCTTDANGNVYMAGFTDSNTSTLISTIGAHQSVHGGGTSDAFLVKFNSVGVRQWGTYYGGNGGDTGYGCSTDASGNVYLIGQTEYNTAAIATIGAHKTVNSGGGQDAFLVKFNSNGVRQWGTYYGGTGDEAGYSCSTDASGNVYFSGSTEFDSGTAVATTGSHQPTHSGGVLDAFLIKFNTSGVRQWGTYYGGTGLDEGYSCSADASGNIYLAGYTSTSTGAIATAGAHQTAYGGTQDAYLVKFNTSGVRQWGTYYGGTGNSDLANSCVTDGSGNVYLAGQSNTNPGTVIATSGSHQSTYGGGTNDAFLVKFNGTGVRQWGTYYGGTGNNDFATSCAVDAVGNIYLTGQTNSNTGTVIATTGAHQSATGGGFQDAFLAKFNDCSGLITTNTSGFIITANTTGASYQWIDCNNGNSPIAGATAQSFTATSNGSYAVIVTNGSCSITSACTSITTVGIVEIESSTVKFYPNPFTNKITIETKTINKTIQFYNVLGEHLKTIQIENEKTEIDLSDLTTGIYFIKTEFNTVKIIKH